MIFHRLAISNFGIYKGFHTIDLDTSAETPIVLVGALNGSGKTTLLDALQLVLYGKHSECSTRGKLGYKAFLEQAINHDADPRKGASISLEFTSFHFGENDRFKVRRSWHCPSDQNISETVEVFKNGTLNKAMTEQWHEYVEVLLPSKIASLFFFDGEQVANVVEKGNTAALIKQGAFALLGLDQIERLKTDLIAVERRRKSAALSSDDKKKITAIEAEITRQQSMVSKLHQKMANIQNELDQCKKMEHRLAKKFQLEGGELFNQQQKYEEELKQLRLNKSRIEGQIREMASGQLPLSMIDSLLKQTEEQAYAEKKAKVSEDTFQELSIRDDKLRELILKSPYANSLIESFDRFIADDYAVRKKSAAIECYLNADPDIFAFVQPEHLLQCKKQAKELVSALAEIEEQIESLDRLLASIPSKEVIKPIQDEIRDVRSRNEKALIHYEHLHEEYLSASNALRKKEEELNRQYELNLDETFSNHLSQNVLERSEKARVILERFRHLVTRKHIGTLESCILESLQYLLRKQDLVHHVSIDPDTYELTLLNKEYNVTPSSRLSAGERQLLVISILWGLAKASGKPLPVIVDTPLGRLDGSHRSHLLDRYFPAASHQVILLSTDKEIDYEYYQSLKPSIGREYSIRYLEDEKTSKISSGYFWVGATND